VTDASILSTQTSTRTRARLLTVWWIQFWAAPAQMQPTTTQRHDRKRQLQSMGFSSPSKDEETTLEIQPITVLWRHPENQNN
jgi:hypothetical protein